MSSKVFAGRYEIIDRIGRGGMGVVYKATDTLLDKIVALKVLTKRVSDQAALRFQAEAKAAGKLNHPNIVKILDFGISEEGEPYMVQEFVEGTNLAELLQPNGLEIEHALGLFDQICSGLAHAHDSGIIHRDVKPSNVIVTKTDDQPLAKLTDFGIAKLVEVNQNLTSTGAMVGSPLYMSPEHAVPFTRHIDENKTVERRDIDGIQRKLLFVATRRTIEIRCSSQLTISIVGPAVILARQSGTTEVPLRVSQKRRSTVTAYIVETVDFALGLANQDKRIAGKLDPDVIADVWHLALVSRVQPLASEDILSLCLIDSRICVPGCR